MSQSLPNDIVFNEIFPRVPSDIRNTWGYVCKLWFHHLAKFRPRHIITIQCLQQTLPLEAEFVFDNITRTVSSSVCNERLLAVSKIIGLPPRPEITILGSCNGLILLRETSSSTMLRVVNPATKQWVNLPCSIRHLRSKKGGLGYDSFGKMFKAVLFLETSADSKQEDCSSECEMLTQGSNVWRAIEFPFETRNVTDNAAVVVDGFMHFAYRKCPGPGYDYMLSLDVGDETFRLSKFPSRALYLLRIDDSVSPIVYDRSCGRLDIWILKDYGNEI